MLLVKVCDVHVADCDGEIRESVVRTRSVTRVRAEGAINGVERGERMCVEMKHSGKIPVSGYIVEKESELN